MRVIERELHHEPIIPLCKTARRLYTKMDASYNRLSAILRERSHDDAAISEAQAYADSLGRRYERLCERICNMEVKMLEGVLAKLRCATQCIRDIMPMGADPQHGCDIELRFVFAIERDVEQLLSL